MNLGKKIFVVGNSRSGTTMMGRILGRNSDVFTFHELHFFEQLWSSTPNPPALPHELAVKLAARLLTIQRDGYFNQKALTPYLAEAAMIVTSMQSTSVTAPMVFSAVLHHEAKTHHKLIPCDQTPRNVYYISEILALYPDAYIVNMIRDPRDVMLSQKNKWKRSLMGAKNIPKKQLLRFWANYHPITMSLMWKSGINAVSKHGNHPRILKVKFEDLLLNPELEIQALCTFLGLTYESGMLTVPQVGSSHQRDQYEARGLDKGAIARWQRAPAARNDLYICEKLTLQGSQSLGYVQSGLRPNPFALLWLGLIWPIKLALAFLLNLGRFQNLGSTLKKRLGLSSTSSIEKTAVS